ncbi:hypothetical protein AGMMS49965_24300 [Bacteroidia bacterium]|nr:hypothetical protein AGMMS49965_24300 [Bacteroidia bacterium]
MKVIMLKGKDDSGKTTTLNLVYDEYYSDKGVSSVKKALGDSSKDFSAHIIYKGKLIVFYTEGDYEYPVPRIMKLCEELSVDVLVCAANTNRTRPVEQIKNYPHEIIKKTEISSNDVAAQKVANVKDAEKIHLAIKQSIEQS